MTSLRSIEPANLTLIATSTAAPTPTSSATTQTFSGTLAPGGRASQPIVVHGAGTLSASVTWTASANLTVAILDPSGQQVALSSGKGKPQAATYNAPAAGTYTVVVASANSAKSTSYTLTVSAP